MVLLSGDLYMRAVAEESRIDAARAQLATTRALHELAQDRKKAGLIPSPAARLQALGLRQRGHVDPLHGLAQAA